MPQTRFEPRYLLEAVTNPDPAWLRGLLLDAPSYEFGDATLSYDDADRSVAMTMLADRELGCYFNHGLPKHSWLSVGDATRLSEVVCPDDWQASAGLFVPPAKA